jgi:hypothetical protein
MALGGVGDHVGQGRLAHAGRPPQDDRTEPVGFDRTAQQPPAPHDLVLPDEFIQRARPHPDGQRRVFFGALGARVIEQIRHGDASRSDWSRQIEVYCSAGAGKLEQSFAWRKESTVFSRQ